jgi:PAS domain S-box-containing protein
MFIELSFPPFSIAFIIAAVMAVGYATVVSMRKPAPGVAPFIIFLLFLAEWMFARSLEAAGIDLGAKIFWGKVMQFGVVSSGVMWVIFSLSYTGSKWWRQPFNLFLLVAIPVISLIFMWTNDWHHLYWPDIYFSPGTEGTVLVWEHGPAFWVECIYNYLAMLSGIVVLWRYLLHKKGVYRTQLIVLLIGTLIPVAANIAYLMGLSPIKGLDLTPFAFLITGIVYGAVIFRFRFLDVVPVARSAMVERMPDGILVLNANGGIVDLNPALIKTGDMKIEKGKRLEQVWPKLEKSRKALGDGKHSEMTLSSGQMMDISVTSLKDREKREVGQLVVLRDITDRRKMEQTLLESEQRYEALVEQSNEAVLIVKEGVYRYANRKAEEIFGYKVEEILGKQITFGIAEEDRKMILERYRARAEGKPAPTISGTISSGPVIYELKIDRKDGEKRNVEVSVGTIRYEGEIANIVTLRDITERKLTQRKLEALYQEEKELHASLQAEMDKRTKYTRALVHELNTPLTSILASGELLEAEIEDKRLEKLINNIRRASHNLKQRIDDLIELARGESGLLKVNIVPLDIRELLIEEVSESEPIAQEKGLKLELEVGNLPLVKGDRSRLRQVISSFLHNAVRYAETGKVVVRGTSEGNSVRVEVEDTGREIRKEELERLFDPYQRRGAEGQELSGLGIGLALSKIIIDLHHGEIKVESEIGKGAKFSFTVPADTDNHVPGSFSDQG